MKFSTTLCAPLVAFAALALATEFALATETTQQTARPDRIDPYKSYRFKLGGCASNAIHCNNSKAADRQAEPLGNQDDPGHNFRRLKTHQVTIPVVQEKPIAGSKTTKLVTPRKLPRPHEQVEVPSNQIPK